MSSSTTQLSKRIAYCFTINNPKHHDSYYEKKCSLFKFWCFQRECGSGEGTVHIQGYIYLHRPQRITALKKVLKRAHFIAADGSPEENAAYCSKTDTRVEGHEPCRGGDIPKGKGERTDLVTLWKLQKSGADMKELFEKCPKQAYKYQQGIAKARSLIKPKRPADFEPDVRLYIGPPGCGKTRLATEEFPDGYSTPIDNAIWFDGYDGHSMGLVDDFSGEYVLTKFLRLIDLWYVSQVAVKGSYVWWCPKTVIITTTEAPQGWYRDTHEHEKRRKQYLALRRRFTLVKRWKPQRRRLDGVAQSSKWILEELSESSEIDEVFEIRSTVMRDVLGNIYQ